jgi:hypothetical protein
MAEKRVVATGSRGIVTAAALVPLVGRVVRRRRA